MFYLVEMCGFCLSDSNAPFKNVHSKSDDQKLTYFEKVTSYLSELKNVIETGCDFVVCEKCCKKIDDIYDYNQTCLKNAKIFSSHKDALKENSDKKRFKLNINVERSIEEKDIAKNESSNRQIPYLSVKNLDTCQHTSNFDSTNVKEPTNCQIVPKLSADQFDIRNQITNIDSLNETVEIKQEPASNLTAGNYNSFHKTSKNGGKNFVIKKEAEEVEPSFGDHYLSSFGSEPQIEMEELDIKMDSINSNDPLLDNDDSNDDDDVEIIQPNQTLPSKSKLKYENTYRNYVQWVEMNKVGDFTSEEAMLAYFEDIAKRYKASSLFAIYSMLKTTFASNLQKDIRDYRKLLAYIKEESKNYVPRKSEVLSKEHVAVFLTRASDDKFLLTKVILIIGLAGSCRKQELSYLPYENIQDLGNSFCIQIPDSKTKKLRKVLISTGDIPGVNFVEIIRKYINLRPKVVDHGRFFIQYRKGVCLKQVVGINSIGATPKLVAKFLNLPNANQFTGHCFRRSSTQGGYAPQNLFDQSIINFGAFIPGSENIQMDPLEDNKDYIVPFKILNQNGEPSTSHQVMLQNPSNFWAAPP